MPFGAEVTNYVKEHPLMTGGIVIGGVAGVLILRHTLAGNTQTASAGNYAYGGISPQEAQLIATGQQSQAQLTAQTNQIAGQEQIAGLQAQYNQNIAQIQANTSITNTNTAAQVQLASIASQGTIQSQSIAASLAGLENTNATAVAEKQTDDATNIDLASILANENENISAGNVGLQQTISNNLTNVAIQESNNAVKIAANSDKTSIASSALGFVGGVVGALL